MWTRQRGNALAGLQRASTRARNTRGNYFLPAREITATAARYLPSETLSISHYFWYETSEHGMVLSPRGNSGDAVRGTKCCSGSPLFHVGADRSLCWFWLCSFEMWQDNSPADPSLSVCQVSTATRPKSFELLGEAAGVLQAAVLLLVSPRTALKPKHCCQPSFRQWAYFKSLILLHGLSGRHGFFREGVVGVFLFFVFLFNR